MIVFDCRSGLGNQMFMYAFARNLQMQYGGRIICDTVLFKSKDYGVPRQFSLGNFKMIDNIIIPKQSIQELLYL